MEKIHKHQSGNSYAREFLIVFQVLRKQVVPRVGLEPTLLSELDFESSASTNSTTGARLGGQFLNGLACECNQIFCNFLQETPAKLRALGPSAQS
jgi:hypothetical protein